VDSTTPYGRSGGGRTTPVAKGVARPPPKAQKKKSKVWVLAFWEWPDHPQGLGGGYGRSGGGRTTPMAKGVIRPPPKGRNPYFFFLSFWGWPDHPLGHKGGSTTPRPAIGGGRIHPQALGGGLATPKRPKLMLCFFVFCFFFWAFGGGRTTPLAMRVVRPPPEQPWGWLQPLLGQKWPLGQATPQFGNDDECLEGVREQFPHAFI
jgi:hypothetical protein